MGVGHLREGPVEVLRTSGLNNLKADPQRPRRDFRFFQPGLHAGRGIWLEEKGDQTDPRNSPLEQLQALADEVRGESGLPIAARMREARDETLSNRIADTK